MRIGLMGGSFDPIHMGHLLLAEQVRVNYNLDKVIFIPAGNPVHKVNREDKYNRYEMTKIAIKDNEYFEICDYEVKKDEISYSIDTVKKLKNDYKDSKLFFITGADAIIQLPTWKNFLELFKLCTFIAAYRPGTEKSLLKKEINDIKKEYKVDILISELNEVMISSTNIRDRLKKGLSIKYLVLKEVEDYIYKNNLYKN